MPDDDPRPERARQLPTGVVRSMPLMLQVVLLAVVTLVLAPHLLLNTAWVGDEGAYAMQAIDIEDGHWAYRYPGQSFDERGSWFPLAATSPVVDDGVRRWYAHPKHPAYSLTLAASIAVAGREIGVHLVPIAGSIAAAVAAWAIAREISGRNGVAAIAFWLTAVGPPLINGFVLWAHATSAAIGGFAVLGALVAARRGVRSLGAVVAIVSAIVGVFLRSEAQLFGIALGVGLVAHHLLLGRERRRQSSAAWVGVLIAGGTVGARITNRVLAETVFRGELGSDSLRGGEVAVDYLEGRWMGAYHVLFQGSEHSSWASRRILVALALVLIAALLLRWQRRAVGLGALGAGALLVACALYVNRFDRVVYESLTGLFAAWPVIIIGFVNLRRREAPVPVFLPIAGVLFLAAVVATQYAEGGGLEWGGRFLSPAAPTLAAVASLGIGSVIRTSSTFRRVAVVAAVAAVAIVPVAEGLQLMRRYREGKVGLIEAVAAAQASPVVVADTRLVELPRIAWRLHPDVTWFMAPNGDANLVLDRLFAQGEEELAIIEPIDAPWSQAAPFPVRTPVDSPVLAGAGLRLVVLGR